MGTKVKGLLKGLRYITQKFDDDKDQEMVIGFPTDVKHVAHIGWDGPSVDTPSWMKEFRSQQGFQSAPLSAMGEPIETPEVKWVSQDSCRRSSRSRNSPSNDNDALPKSRRNNASSDGDSPAATESPTGDSSTKSRQSRRSSKTNRHPKDSSVVSDSSSRGKPDIPKKERRKKSKESVGGGSSRSSRSKANAPTSYSSPFSDPGADSDSISRTSNSENCQSYSSKPSVVEEDKEGNKVS